MYIIYYLFIIKFTQQSYEYWWIFANCSKLNTTDLLFNLDISKEQQQNRFYLETEILWVVMGILLLGSDGDPAAGSK